MRERASGHAGRTEGAAKGRKEGGKDGEKEERKEGAELAIEGRRGGEAAGCSAEVDVAGPAELATSVGQRSQP